MESLQLEDLPLFNGDLLSVELTAPQSDVEGLSSCLDEGLFGLQQDGSTWMELTLAEPSPKQTAASNSLVTELLNSPNTASNEDLLGSEWLDTRVDLMEYLGSDEQMDLSASSAVVEAVPSDASQLLDSLSLAVQQSSPVPSATTAAPTNQAVDMMEVLAKLTEAMDDNFVIPEQSGVEFPCEPILSPMSAEEVESILSSGPTSPGNSSIVDDSGFVDGSPGQYSTVDVNSFSSLPGEQDNTITGAQREKSKSRSTPYSKPANSKESKAMERKLRKKQQNKDAALRYRLKKKSEGDTAQQECDKLEERNKELREKVDTMTREINYLKNLMAEVYKAKGLIK